METRSICTFANLLDNGKADSGMIVTPAQELKERLEEKINGDFQEYCGTCCGKTSKCDLHLP